MSAPEPTSSEAERFGCVAAAWQAHHGELLGYLRHRLRDTDTAADLLHDVFVKAMRQGQGFCRLDDPRAWLFQVARNAIVDHARAAHPTEPLPDEIDAFAAPEPAALPAVDDLAGCLAKCLEELSTDDAEILRGCDLEGETVRAWAEAHGLGLAAAKSRLLRARQRLRERMTRVCQVRFDEHGNVDGHVPRART